jgi:predicted ATPase
VTPALRLLTFEDIVELAASRRSAARAPDKIAGWDQLLAVARSLAGPGGGTDDLAVDRTWSLVKIRIQGYQGVGDEPLEIDLDPTPGVTVIHGPNGSGKSSIADAIETALHGEPRKPLAIGTGGNEPLWEREHCGRDAEEASVEVTLLGGGQQLVLSCRLDTDGRVTQRRARRITGSDATGGGTSDFDLSTTSWHSALIGHRPVFGYAAVERHVQSAGDLQEFLEPLLAFGGCFEALKTAVAQAGAASAAAKGRWDRALASAQRAVVAVDAQRTRPGASDLPDIEWPGIGDDPTSWLASAGLTEAGATVPEVTEQHHDRLSAAATTTTRALSDLEGAETSLHARLAGPLTDLHARAADLPEPGTTCPVCAASDTAWLSTLHGSLTGLVGIEDEDKAFQLALGALRRVVDTDLADVAVVLTQDWCDDQIAAAGAPAVERAAELRAALDRHGQRPTPEVRAAVRAIGEQLTGEGWRAAVVEAAQQSDHRRQWLRARRAAVDGFVGTWEPVAPDGSAAASWRTAETCVRDVQNQLRKERTDGLQTLTDTAVQQLLRDVGLSVTALSVQGTKAAVQVTDGTGKRVRLSMLSAGQRNALLLAPLLAVSRGGPFGFLVLDDPVHAFDQVRVDRLARIVHDLAGDRRVIVLTHDERLKEHLLARSTACDVRSVRRDAATGVVTSEVTDSMWKVLLDDARDALKVAGSHQGGVTTTPDDLVRGLCRMALDNALRQFVIQQAAWAKRDPDPDLAVLDDAKTTRKRIDAARGMYPSSDAPTVAETRVQPYFPAWNAAAHGEPSTYAADLAEVDAAESACAALAP